MKNLSKFDEANNRLFEIAHKIVKLAAGYSLSIREFERVLEYAKDAVHELKLPNEDQSSYTSSKSSCSEKKITPAS